MLPTNQDTAASGREEHARQKNASELHAGQAQREGVLHQDAHVKRAGFLHQDAHVNREGVGDEDSQQGRRRGERERERGMIFFGCMCACVFVSCTYIHRKVGFMICVHSTYVLQTCIGDVFFGLGEILFFGLGDQVRFDDG